VKIKLDENIGRRGLELLKASGHDVMTVWDQGFVASPTRSFLRFAAPKIVHSLPSIVILAKSRDFRPHRAPE